jgi:hypothetical protein
MPDADGVTALAAWLLICICFVFCALMCYAYLLWRLKPSILLKHLKRERATEVIDREESDDATDSAINSCPNPAAPAMGTTGATANDPVTEQDFHLLRVDDTALVVFPLAFVMAHVVYWSVCLHESKHGLDIWEMFEMEAKQHSEFFL